MPRRALAPLLALLLAAAAAPAAGAAGLRATGATMARAMRAGGPWSGAYATDLTSGRVILSWRADVARPPASVEKLFTTSAALLRLGPSATLDTRAVAEASPDLAGVLHGDLWLRGGGDPTLTRARVRALADALAAGGLRRVEGSVVGDGSVLDPLPGSYRTGGRFDTDMGGAIAGLEVDRGLAGAGAQADPALTAARVLAGALRDDGVKVAGATQSGAAPADATTLATTSSAPLAQVVALTNAPSDNLYAETLMKDLGAQLAGAGTTAAGAGVVRGTLAPLGVQPSIYDGSGLARADRVTPRQVVALLGAAARSAIAQPLLASLAVPGVSGTLVHRLRGTVASTRCAGKTGTIDWVSNLAGVCTTRDGHRIAFAVLMQGIATWRAHALQDRMMLAVARLTATAP